MKMKKLLALLLVMAMVVSITPVGTLAENLGGDAPSVGESAGNGNEGSGDAAPGGTGGDPAGPGEGEGNPADPGEGEGNPAGPGEGEGEDPAGPGEGEGEDPIGPGEGEGEDPAGPGEGEGEDPAGPGEGEGEDPTDPGEDPGEEVPEEEQPPLPEEVEEEPADEAAFIALVERLGAAETIEGLWAALRALTADEWILLEWGFDAEGYEQLLSFAELDSPILPEPVDEPEEWDGDMGPVPFTKVAPLLPPVSGPVPMMKGLRMSTMVKIASALSLPGLELSKQAVRNGDQYKITLDAYVTGEFDSTTIESTVPADIILVLDESGSMDYQLTEYVYTSYSNTFSNAYNARANLYLKNAGGSYSKVDVARQGLGIPLISPYQYRFTLDGSSLHGWQPGGTQINSIAALNGKIYQRAEVNSGKTRREALQEAATNFVNAVREDHATITEGTGHRIAVVGFSSSSRQILGLTDCTDEGVMTAINGLNASGSTNSGAGMERAKNILLANPVPAGESRNQVAIMFTDGVPTTSTAFSSTVANNAIAQAKTIKDNGASVYTIGIFADANVNGTDDPNKYMNYVSSNYPNASSLTNSGTGDPQRGFYLVASNSEELNTIFERLAEVIENGNPAQAGLDGTTVLKDVISPYFQLLTGVKDTDVTVYTALYQGKDTEGNDTFAAPVPYPDAVVQLIGDRTVHVSGFNYSGNFVAMDTNNDPVGQKLIVEVLVKPIDGFFGGNQVPTNTDASGIYKDNTPQATFNEPVVNVPLAYTVETKDQTIYLGNSAPVSGMINWSKAPSPEPDGIKNAFVDLNFTVNDVNYSVPYKATGYTALSGAVTPTDCTDYPISYEVTPIYDGTEVAIDGDATATVHVLKPTISTQDAWSDYNGTVDLAQCVDLGEDNANVTWTDFNNHSNLPAVTGTKPILNASDFTYRHMEGNAAVAGTTFQPTIEANFQITGIKIGVQPFDSTYFRFGGNSHTDADPAHASDRHFTIHLNLFDFTLTKQVGAKADIYPQDFIFAVEYGGETYPISIVSTGGAKTIQGLPYGKGSTITATEKDTWSWRYTASGNQTKSVSVSGNDVSYGEPPTLTAPEGITFTNTLTNDKWLGGTARADNRFGQLTQ